MNIDKAKKHYHKAVKELATALLYASEDPCTVYSDCIVVIGARMDLQALRRNIAEEMVRLASNELINRS